MSEGIKAFLKRRQAEIAETGSRPVDSMMRRLLEVSGPTKLEHKPPDAVPPTPDGNKPTVRKPRKPTNGYTR